VPEDEASFEAIKTTLKRCTKALEEADVEFMVGGSLAAWARGGPETRNDLDLMLRPRDADRALSQLEGLGMKVERPPEQWLYKAWDGEVLVDLIFELLAVEHEGSPAERHPIGDHLFERADDLRVFGVVVPVMSLEDLLATKLLALEPHSLDYESSLAIARALREEIDWEELRMLTGDSPYATAFFTMLEELKIINYRSPSVTSCHRGIPGSAS
jgi:hypothetical protein